MPEVLFPGGLEPGQAHAHRVQLRQRAERIDCGDQRAGHVVGADSGAVHALHPRRTRRRARVALTCERDPYLRLAGVDRERRRHCKPASLQAASYAAVQMSPTSRKPSLINVLSMLSF